MNEKPGLILDNEVFDEDEKSSVGDSWMNEIPGLIWTMKFLMRMKKVVWGIHG